MMERKALQHIANDETESVTARTVARELLADMDQPDPRDALLRDAAAIITRNEWRIDNEGWHFCRECGARCDDWDARRHIQGCPTADVLRRLDEAITNGAPQ